MRKIVYFRTLGDLQHEPKPEAPYVVTTTYNPAVQATVARLVELPEWVLYISARAVATEVDVPDAHTVRMEFRGDWSKTPWAAALQVTGERTPCHLH